MEIEHKKEVETEKLRVVKKTKDVYVNPGDGHCLKTKQFVNTWNTLFHLDDMSQAEG
jgi:hypothetical protein